MNWTALAVGVISMGGSIFGAFLAVRVSLARIDEHIRGVDDRLNRHSNRINRIEDSHFKVI